MTDGDPVVAREATPADNDALVALSLACPMEGDIGLCVDRTPDFFALNRLEGARWRVAVVDGPDGSPVGCISVAERSVYLNRHPATTMYVSDLKVHPAHRGGGVADALSDWARAACLAAGEDVPTFLTILAGNRAMERRMTGPRGLPQIERVATIRTHTISLLWKRRSPTDAGVRVMRGESEDLEEMVELWHRVAPGRQFATAFGDTGLADWIGNAPGLDPSCYWLARRSDGRLAGFFALWDQSTFKQMRVTSYSRRLATARVAFNAVAPAVRATRLPGPGGALHNLNAIHVCVPPDKPGVLRALVIEAYNASRDQGYSFLNVGLDIEDPLTKGLSGLLAQPTDIWFCLGLVEGASGVALDRLPVHHEIALV